MSLPSNKELGITGWIDEAEQLRRNEEMKVDMNKPLPTWMSELEVMKEAGREFQQARTKQILSPNNIVRPYKLNEYEKV